MSNPLLALSWADIQALPPGTRRDQLAYAWRHRNRAARDRKAEAIAQSLLTAAEAQHLLDLLPLERPETVAARRRELLRATR